MSTSANFPSTVIPVLRYRNVAAAVDWLCLVFGFEKRQVFADADGAIGHAELTLNGGMVMLGPAGKTTEFSKLMKQPDEIGGFETQCSYLVVTDADATYARAVAAHAKIEIALMDEDYGGRGFVCRDLEGRVWSIGTYDPWKQSTAG
ncbi:MAG: VOC family protein [Gammaproteobacteria bacterium]|nr:VOC family protein [Gammaproteobacteria bacterium]